MSVLKNFKQNFFFTIQTMDEYSNDYESEDYLKEVYEDGELIVTAWVGDHMIDQCMTELYPELEDLGLIEEMESLMFSTGIYDKSVLESKLHEMGFKTSRDEIDELDSEALSNMIDKMHEERENDPREDSEPYATMEDVEGNLSINEIEIRNLIRKMNKAVANEDYLLAAQFRDVLKLKQEKSPDQ